MMKMMMNFRWNKKHIDKYHEYLTRKKQRIEERKKKKLNNE